MSLKVVLKPKYSLSIRNKCAYPGADPGFGIRGAREGEGYEDRLWSTSGSRKEPLSSGGFRKYIHVHLFERQF
jgi:hypothetical protein